MIDGATTGTPRVSVIIPAYNVEDWIPLTIESILGQSERNIEVIVVDDHSTDNTVQAIVDAAGGDPRVRVLRDAEAKGGAHARNFGIRHARGEFLAFADGDDVVPAHAYERLLAQADRSGNAMVIGNHVTIEPQRLVNRGWQLKIYSTVREGLTLPEEPLFLRDRVCWNRIIHRDTWNALGLQFAEARRSNDIQAMTKAYARIPFDVIPEPVYMYRRRQGSSSMTSSKLRPDSLADHFTQELACCDIVRDLGDRTLTDAYFRGILGFDVWAHGQEAVLRDEPEFDRVRDLLFELVTRASRDAVRSLTPHQQVVYDLIARRDWELARVALGEQGMEMVEGLEILGEQRGGAETLVAAAAAGDRGSRRAAAWLLRASYLKVLRYQHHLLSDAEMVWLQRRAQSVARAAMLPRRAFDFQEARLLRQPAGSAAALRAIAAPSLRNSLGASYFLLEERVGGALKQSPGEFELRDLRPREVLQLAKRVRPRHVKRAVKAVWRRVRR